MSAWTSSVTSLNIHSRWVARATCPVLPGYKAQRKSEVRLARDRRLRLSRVSFWSARYVFSLIGISRCDVRAACSGATPSNDSAARLFVPPANTRAGTAQRAIPTIASKHVRKHR